MRHHDVESPFVKSFSHFVRTGWAIEKAGLPRIILAAVDAVAELVSKDHVVVHLEEVEMQRPQSALTAIKTALHEGQE
jgi:hypothetical protein